MSKLLPVLLLSLVLLSSCSASYTDDIDAMVLYTLAVHLGFGPKRLRRFYEAFAAEHDRLIQHYEMPDDYTWLCKEELKKDWCRCGGMEQRKGKYS